jgi:hypothetical protein
MTEAMRSMPECADSDNMPSEPVTMPVMSLSTVMTDAASTEKIAAERLAAWGWMAAGSCMAVGVIGRCYRFCGRSAWACMATERPD